MNIETILIKYLQDALNTDNVFAEVPEVPVDEYWVVDKTGSSTVDRITTSTVAIQSYAGSKLLASEANEKLKEAMDSIVALNEIGGCHLNSDYNFTNTAKRQHRYQAVYDITHY